MRNSRKGDRRLGLLGVGCGLVVVAGLVAFSPALAGRSVDAGGTGSCNSSAPCLQRTNKGSGPGLQGVSKAGNGVVGETTLFSKTAGAAGVEGLDLATPNPSGSPLNNVGVFGQSSSGIGVRGVANAGTAVVGNASGGSGVFGTTQSNIPGIGSAGVFGEDVGSSSIATGVTGFSRTGIGVQGDNFEAGINLNAAVLGLTFKSSLNTYFPAAPTGGLFNSDIGEGVVAETSGSQSEALGAANFGGGPIMRGYAARSEVMELDNAGNLIITGKLTQHGNPHAVARTATGRDVVMYAPAAAAATVEDVGEARLSGGETYVRLDPRFAGTMNRARPYLVFLTPQGDTPGLYVAGKTAGGFTVREHSARSNIAFDYRIVAEPYASAEARLADAPRLASREPWRTQKTNRSDFLPGRGLQVHR